MVVTNTRPIRINPDRVETANGSRAQRGCMSINKTPLLGAAAKIGKTRVGEIKSIMN